jgi:hypothetical protein
MLTFGTAPKITLEAYIVDERFTQLDLPMYKTFG